MPNFKETPLAVVNFNIYSTPWPGLPRNFWLGVLRNGGRVYAKYPPNGPRANPALSDLERSSITNAIWLCRHHARIIDKDPQRFSAEQLFRFKASAESRANTLLLSLDREVPSPIGSFIAITSELLFHGTWISAEENIWTFLVDSFVDGDSKQLEQLSLNFDRVAPWDKFIAIESLGDGRPLQKFSWELNAQNQHVINCLVGPKAPRKDPHTFGRDIAYDFEKLDSAFEDGDFAEISGLNAAIQDLQLLLISLPGDYSQFPSIGSHFSRYCAQYSSKPDLLNSLIKTELIRLSTVTYPSNTDQKATPELDFINLVLKTEIIDINLPEKRSHLNLELEFGNFERWEGQILIPIR